MLSCKHANKQESGQLLLENSAHRLYLVQEYFPFRSEECAPVHDCLYRVSEFHLQSSISVQRGHWGCTPIPVTDILQRQTRKGIHTCTHTHVLWVRKKGKEEAAGSDRGNSRPACTRPDEAYEGGWVWKRGMVGGGPSSGILHRVGLVRAQTQPPLCKGPKHTGREIPDLH